MDLTTNNKERKTRRKKAMDVNISAMVYGKVPPQAKDLEEAILGAIMLEKNAFDKVSEVLKNSNPFYVDAHQRIFMAMKGMFSKGAPIDMHTVCEELRQREELDMIGGPYYVSKLTNSVVSSANIEYHAQIVLSMFIKREIIRIGGGMVSLAYEDSSNAFEIMEEVESNVFEVTNILHKKNFENIIGLYVQAMTDLEKRRELKEKITGVTSGFKNIDRLTNGWQPGNLIILAARPSVGKTALALNFLLNAAKSGVPTALFSLEMGALQILNRLLAAQSEYSLERILKGRLDDTETEDLYKKSRIIGSLPMFIDDSPALNILELRAKCRRLKNVENVGLIIIDYLQLMSGFSYGGNREQEISQISRSLKALAKELQVPIIALSQLSRELEKRKDGNRMPQLSDLRESGAIEQDADSVIFIYRPEYHGINHNEVGESSKGETLLRWAKHRDGALETLKLRADLLIQKFTEENFMFNARGGDYKRLAANDNIFPTITTATKFSQLEDSDEDPFPKI